MVDNLAKVSRAQHPLGVVDCGTVKRRSLPRQGWVRVVVCVLCFRNWLISVAAVALAGGSLTVIASPAAAQTYSVRVTCKVPADQKERQMAPNWCLNYLPDGTQTFTARVKDSNGNPVRGVTVKWSDSDSSDASFRSKQNPCVTGSAGTCSAELTDAHPRDGEKITVTATADGATGKGYLSFSRR
jgi:hypothetical protein